MMESQEPIKVGMAEMKTASASASIITTGLGSCVGVCVWDKTAQVGGMVHVMLPDSGQTKNAQNKAKFADTGVSLLLEELLKKGASKARLAAKIAGGAQMFNFPGTTSIMRIGERNTEAVKKCLEKEGIRLVAEDTGGNYGRTIEFFVADGKLLIKTVNKGEKII